MKEKIYFLISSTILSLLLWKIAGFVSDSEDLLFGAACVCYGIPAFSLFAIILFVGRYPKNWMVDFLYTWFVIAFNTTIQYATLQRWCADHNFFLRVFIGIVAAVFMLYLSDFVIKKSSQ